MQLYQFLLVLLGGVSPLLQFIMFQDHTLVSQASFTGDSFSTCNLLLPTRYPLPSNSSQQRVEAKDAAV